jgi:hypothetical protein
MYLRCYLGVSAAMIVLSESESQSTISIALLLLFTTIFDHIRIFFTMLLGRMFVYPMFNKPHELSLSNFSLVWVAVFSEDILDIELMKEYILCLAPP